MSDEAEQYKRDLRQATQRNAELQAEIDRVQAERDAALEAQRQAEQDVDALHERVGRLQDALTRLRGGTI